MKLLLFKFLCPNLEKYQNLEEAKVVNLRQHFHLLKIYRQVWKIPSEVTSAHFTMVLPKKMQQVHRVGIGIVGHHSCLAMKCEHPQPNPIRDKQQPLNMYITMNAWHCRREDSFFYEAVDRVYKKGQALWILEHAAFWVIATFNL